MRSTRKQGHTWSAGKCYTAFMEEKRVDLAHGMIAYLTHGSGATMLFFHGGSVNPKAYIPLIELLGQHCSVVAPTHPGHGTSFRLPKSWTIDDFVTTYREFLAVLNLEPSVVVGHSFGGMLALLLAARGIGDRIIVFDPCGLPFSLTPKAYLAAKKREAQELLSYANDIQRVHETLSAAGVLLYTVIRRFDDIAFLAKRIPKADISNDLATVRQPVHIFWGKDDGIVPLSIGKRMRALLKNATLVTFPNRGHTYPVTDPVFTYNQLMPLIRDNDTVHP